jgi:pimeloyl-ACP methyl ester carboxylesterase
LPTPDVTLVIDGLGQCTDQADRSLRLKYGAPVNVLVHGCEASAGRFRTLAQVFAFQGQQTVCYSYNDRHSLTRVAADLRRRLEQLASATGRPPLTLIGHSQGGLIARHAMRESDEVAPALTGSRQRLVTISAPFAGISAADHCASPVARVISLGLVVPICWAISGEKWYEITHASDFMRKPGRLRPSVTGHLNVVTDERGSCRRADGETCLEDDFVFTLAEQTLPENGIDERVRSQVLKAGHAEVVGTGRDTPFKLIGLLQEQGVLNQTPVVRRLEFQRYLARVYHP